MRTLGVVNFVTLDGVIQSPASPDEDRSGGFEYGGWANEFVGEEWGKDAAEGMSETDALLFGRKTYQKMEAHWPNEPDSDPIARMMNRSQKYVVSRTLDEVTWENSHLINGDVVAEIGALKEEPGKSITILGSGDLLQTLMAADLIDHYKLLVCPIVLGKGKRLFKEGAAKTSLELVDATPTSTGGTILTYRSGNGSG